MTKSCQPRSFYTRLGLPLLGAKYKDIPLLFVPTTGVRENRTHQKVHYRRHHLARGSPHITNRKSNPLLHYFRKSLRHQPETKDRRYENRSLSIEYLSLRKSFTLHSAYSLHFTKKKKINKGTKTISIIITINTKEKIFLNNATKPEQPKYQTNLKRV